MVLSGVAYDSSRRVLRLYQGFLTIRVGISDDYTMGVFRFRSGFSTIQQQTSYDPNRVLSTVPFGISNSSTRDYL